LFQRRKVRFARTGFRAESPLVKISIAPIFIRAVIALLLFWQAAQAGEPRHGYFSAADGTRLHYLTLGRQGSWVVLIHGYTDTAERMWVSTGIAQTLAAKHRVVAIDNRNHGLSATPEPHGLGRWEDVLELMDHLGIERAHIHGYSTGGGMMARLMAKHPQRFITAAFGGSGIAESEQASRAAAAQMDQPMPEPQGEEAAAFARIRASSEARSKESGPRAARVPLQIDLTKITFPVLAINGEYDRPYSKTQRMWRELPDFQNVVIPKKNHVSAIMVGGPMPSEYVAALVRFIDSHDSGK
jgi:pimeloyl-ACP methyl ester carboxylesterase